MINNRNVIVTLTTIPERLDNIYPTLMSIIQQSIKPDEIVLSLPLNTIRDSKNTNPYILTPKMLSFLKQFNITLLRPNNDYGPATKLLGLLERELSINYTKETEPIIITFDDDKIYSNNCIKILLDGHVKYPKCAIARKGLIILQTDKINNYLYKYSKIKNKENHQEMYKVNQKVIIGCSLEKDQYINVLCGTSGALYQPSFFKQDIFNIPELELSIDDVYLSGYLASNNTKIIVPKFKKNEFTKKTNNPNYLIDPDTINKNISSLQYLNNLNIDISTLTVYKYKSIFNKYEY